MTLTADAIGLHFQLLLIFELGYKHIFSYYVVKIVMIATEFHGPRTVRKLVKNK